MRRLLLAALLLAACGGGSKKTALPEPDAFRLVDGWVECPDDATMQRIDGADRRTVICTWPCSSSNYFRDRTVVMAFACHRDSDGNWTEWQITDFGPTTPAGERAPLCPVQ